MLKIKAMREEMILFQITKEPNASFHVYAVREIIFDGLPCLICEVETHHGFDVDYLQVTIPQHAIAEVLKDRGDIEHYDRHAVKWTNGDVWNLRRLYSVGADLREGWIEDAVTWYVKELAEHLALNKNGLNKTLRAEAEAWGV